MRRETARIQLNALYNLKDDEFAKTVGRLKVFYPTQRADMALYQRLSDSMAVHYDHKYIHSDFIVDYYVPQDDEDEEGQEELTLEDTQKETMDGEVANFKQQLQERNAFFVRRTRSLPFVAAAAV